MPSTDNTSASSARTQIIEAAYTLFSQRGFEAVSLSDIASSVGVTKQAIIYHFKTKNALYAEVLAQLATRHNAMIERVRAEPGNPEERWRFLLLQFGVHAEQWPADAGLIARELLDNSHRARDSRKWYLRDFLNSCVALYAATERGSGANEATQRVVVYHHIGAITYLAISRSTLGAIWGAKAVAEMERMHLDVLAEAFS